MTATFFWYDFETTGVDPRRDRPIQVAGIRTNEALEEVEPPLNLYCRLSDDILPHPSACLITGISPQQLAEQGMAEPEFMARLHQELARPQTCSAGYNTLRFDDEVVRHSLYRNFFDPYAREWQAGNSRWDLIDLVRSAYALRPDGIVWPEEEGRVSLKLEHLSAANGLVHDQAHNALSDVRATLALARLIRERQPKLYAYYYGLRHKAEVCKQVRLLEPVVHVSGRFSAERYYLALVLPLAWHPTNRNALVVCDLGLDPSPLWTLSAAELRQRLYTRRDQLAEGELPVPLKLVHVNRSPMLAPVSVLKNQPKRQAALDLALCWARARQVQATADQWQGKLKDVYAQEAVSLIQDPEQQLYSGFVSPSDRRLCERVRHIHPVDLQSGDYPFSDPRLSELLFRYRARHGFTALSASEQQRWRAFCAARLTDSQYGAPMTLAAFDAEVMRLLAEETSPQKVALLREWANCAQQLQARYLASV